MQSEATSILGSPFTVSSLGRVGLRRRAGGPDGATSSLLDQDHPAVGDACRGLKSVKVDTGGSGAPVVIRPVPENLVFSRRADGVEQLPHMAPARIVYAERGPGPGGQVVPDRRLGVEGIRIAGHRRAVGGQLLVASARARVCHIE